MSLFGAPTSQWVEPRGASVAIPLSMLRFVATAPGVFDLRDTGTTAAGFVATGGGAYDLRPGTTGDLTLIARPDGVAFPLPT